ncbi:hypothetical protein Tsubulata_020311 [Turnera subulata]|uniref:MADS-box domain-containing protein n=1 Tax=Turnera subulata TaxID=218843 RepID=A0A9Q0G7B7_9ROSI|nr:hypothetical protein Tsubulata_020311 [Turnera subulata]
MTRKKVKLEWIANDSARKASLKKRRAGLLKKVSELATLCGVSAFVIIYSPDDPEPVVWPSRQVVEQLMVRYQSLPDMEKTKKMMNQEGYLKDRKSKMEDQVQKQLRNNMEMELGYLLHQIYQDRGFDGLSEHETDALGWLLLERVKEIRKRADYFEQVPPFPSVSSFFGPIQGQHSGGNAANDDEDEDDEDDDDGDDESENSLPSANVVHNLKFPDQWFTDAMKHKEIGMSRSDMMGLMPLPYYTTAGAGAGAASNYAGEQTDLGATFLHRNNNNNNSLGLGLLPYDHANQLGGHNGGTSLYSLGVSDHHHGNIVNIGTSAPPGGGVGVANYFDAGLPLPNMARGNLSGGGTNLNLDFSQGNIGGGGGTTFDLGLNPDIAEKVLGPDLAHHGNNNINAGDNIFQRLGLGHGNFERSNVGRHGLSELGFPNQGLAGGGSSTNGSTRLGGSDPALRGLFLGGASDAGMPSDHVTKNWPANPSP